MVRFPDSCQEFVLSYGEDWASRGYTVFGINHPYDVGAVRLDDGTIVPFRSRAFGDNDALAMRMRERAADLRFVLDELPQINAGTNALAGRLDLSRIALVGPMKSPQTEPLA